jgi:hypothetical protein
MEKYNPRGIKTHVPGLTKSRDNESWTYIHRWPSRFQEFGGWWTLKKLRYDSKGSDVAEVWKWSPGLCADRPFSPVPSRGLAPHLLLTPLQASLPRHGDRGRSVATDNVASFVHADPVAEVWTNQGVRSD